MTKKASKTDLSTKASAKVEKVCMKCDKVITNKGYIKQGDLYCCNVCCKKDKSGKMVCEFC